MAKVRVGFNPETGSLSVTSSATGVSVAVDTTDTKQLTATDRQLIALLFRLADGTEREMSGDRMREVLAISQAQHSWRGNAQKRFCALTYDIPDVHPASVGNLIRRLLRPRGSRFNLSCWCVPADRIPTDVIAEMRSMEPPCEVELFRYDAAEYTRIIALSIRRFAEQIARDFTSLANLLRRTERNYRSVIQSEESTAREVQDAGRERNNQRRTEIRNKTEGLAATLNAAEMFGVNNDPTVQRQVTRLQKLLNMAQTMLSRGEQEYPPLRAVGDARKKKVKV